MSMTRERTDNLRRLAERYGIATSYTAMDGKQVRPPDETVLSALRSLGADVGSGDDLKTVYDRRLAEDWMSICDPSAVAWDGSAEIEVRLPSRHATTDLNLTLTLEGGDRLSESVSIRDYKVIGSARPEPRASYLARRVALPWVVPAGYHRLELESGEVTGSMFIISSPRRAFQHDRERSWGTFLPLYSLTTSESWGAGNFTDLGRLVGWTTDLGGSYAGTLPLLAAFLDKPFQPEPYAPVSRQFWNEFFIDVTAVPEMAHSEAARELIGANAFQSELAALRSDEFVDYRRGMKVRRQVLEQLAQALFADPSDRFDEFQRWLEARPVLGDYARFRAICERHNAGPGDWPRALRPDEITSADFDEAVFSYHAYVQWIADQQLAAISNRSDDTGLYLDLPIGVSGDGFDLWNEPAAFATGFSVGAPPDLLGENGQNWGLPPLHPRGLQGQSYRHFIAIIQHHMRHASMLRVDHIMGLHRQFWIPTGADSADGTYVHYPADDLYAILILESHRNRTELVGEDLGTVPTKVRPKLEDHEICRMIIVPFEVRPDSTSLDDVPKLALAALNTHDLPPFAGICEQWFDDERQQVLVGLLEEQGRLDDSDEPDMQAIIAATLEHLGASGARSVLVNLEDLWLETRSQNIPGTTGKDHPNWRRKAVSPLKSFQDHRRSSERWHGSMLRVAKAPERIRTLDCNRFRPGHLSLNEGSHLSLADHLGAHISEREGRPGTAFGVWAPNAESVSVVGDFNGWDQQANPLAAQASSGIWSGFVPDVGQGARYKYHIRSRHNDYRVNKADPFAFHAETSPATASIVWPLDYEWGDDEWMAARGERNSSTAPQSIYEVHLGSWMRVPDENDRSLSYREIAPKLAEYVLDMGFTHVELLPIMEHPFYGSWGYQTTGYFAPTSRYGTPQEFMYLVDHLHQHGIGVILDWVPSHFPSDEHGLAYFDGTHLFEHSDPRQGYHPDWNSYIFNYGRNEVRSFLLSSALFWFDKYHIDGLRVDAVASMLYLDYSRKEGEWIPNQYGGRENLEAIDFLRRFNSEVYGRHPDTQTTAEESTAWPMVSRPTYIGGLGFGQKWDMGWMHDTLQYFTRDPVHRNYHHHELTFRMIYAFTENFVLPLSHDEVVHGKGSMLDKMPGDEWQKFANLRLLYSYMIAQPGKKLLFMGSEFGQGREWNHDASLDWHLLDIPAHQGVQKTVRDLNRIYRESPALHRTDFNDQGFEWIDANDAEHSVLSFLRKDPDDGQKIIAVFNLTPVPRHNYRVGTPESGTWHEIFNSDASGYGGSGQGNLGGAASAPVPWNGRPASIVVTVPPLSALFFSNGIAS